MYGPYYVCTLYIIVAVVIAALAFTILTYMHCFYYEFLIIKSVFSNQEKYLGLKKYVIFF